MSKQDSLEGRVGRRGSGSEGACPVIVARPRGRFLTMHKRRRKRLTTRSLHDTPALLDDIHHGLAQCILERVWQWPFNAFILDTVTGGRSLPVLCVHLFHWYGLMDHFNLDVVLIWKFFSIVEEGYHSTNPYHNAIHATDVTQAIPAPYHVAFTLFPQLSANKSTCLLRFVLVLLACCASILNVTLIAVDRYLAIVHPFKYETFMTKRVVRRVIFAACLQAVLLSTVPLYWNTWTEATSCELGQVLPRYYTIAVLMPAFLVVWSTMIAIYWRIWREACSQAEKLRRTNVCIHCRPSFQVVLLVMGCFTVCWLPFLGVACAQAAGLRDRVSTQAYKAVLVLALSSSALNPLIYAWKNREFKEAFRHIVTHSNHNVVTADKIESSAVQTAV